MNPPEPSPLAQPAVDPPGPDDRDEEIARLDKRWRREREARLESERIAESGLRRLWEAKNDLDRRVEERTAELAEARYAAEAADRAKTEFLANLGHEVRTPLQTILSALELATPGDPDQQERLDRAAAAAAGLHELFTNLLELAQLEVGAVESHLRPTDLVEVADELVHRWRAPLVARGLLLVPESGGRAVTDPDRLLQMGDLLLSNAARFATDGTVRLEVVGEHTGVRLVVSDDGPGIDPGASERIFEPFVQLHGSNDREVSGSGIGLAVVRGLARHLGGDASADTSDAGGLTIRVELPAHDPSTPSGRKQ